MMNFFDNIKNYIAHLDKKEFYKYSGASLGILILMTIGIMYYHYNRVHFWIKRIKIINEEREEIRKILDADQLVLNQRAQVDAMLAETPDYKLEGYFTDLVAKHGFDGSKKPSTEVTFGERNDPQYREVFLEAKFDSMTMQQLCELLDEIEQNKRIYTEKIEIKKSTKIPNTIMVNLTIATLQRKPEQTEIAE